MQIAPCDSIALQRLGNAQLVEYENDPDSDRGKQCLREAENSFRASITMEGKPNVGDPPDYLVSKYRRSLVRIEYDCSIDMYTVTVLTLTRYC